MAISKALLGHLLMPRALIVVAGWNTRVKGVPTDLLVPVTLRCELEFHGDSDFGKKSPISRAEVVGALGIEPTTPSV